MRNERYKINQRIVGIASFYKAPICEDLDKLSADVAMIGVPWDEGAGFLPGARLGPRNVREYSTRYCFYERGEETGGYWDVDEQRSFLTDVSIVDCGDADILYTDFTYTFASITAIVRRILQKGALPVVIGGNHSITPAVVAAFDSINPLDVIHLDAHLDYMDAVHTVRYVGGTPIRRVAEYPFVRHIAQLGIRGSGNPERDYRASLARGNKIVTTKQIKSWGAKRTLDRIQTMERVFVSLDIDVFDPGVMPGVSSPSPGGLLYDEVKDLLVEVAARTEVVGYELVEVNPMVDRSGLTAATTAWLNLEFLASIFDRSSSRRARVRSGADVVG